MNPLPFQLGSTLAVLALAFGLLRRQRLSVASKGLWLAIWSFGLLLVWFPDLSAIAAKRLGITRGVDVVTYLSIGVLSWLVFRLHATIERQQQTISRLVSELAIAEALKEEGL